MTFEVTQNGDCFDVPNSFTLEGCLQGVEVRLPNIAGATYSFIGNPPVGTFEGTVWVIGDWCENESVTYDFKWKVCITNIDQAVGTYTGLAITSTNQDVVDDSFELIIEKNCPVAELDNPGEDCGVVIEEKICYENPVKPEVKTKVTRVRSRVGRAPVATKRKVATKQKIDNCPNDVSIS